MRYSKADKDQAVAKLREWLKPGAVISCVSRHTSRSGMSRSISLFAMVPGSSAGASDMLDISYQASRVIDEPIDQKHGGIRIGGCGMDMGFALVYALSSALFPDGFGCIGRGPDGSGIYCPSSDHVNGDRDYTPHPGCGTPDKRGHRDHWHASGGYALRHRWM